MEDVLDVYALPLDPQQPQVCFDERPVQLVSDVYEPLPAQPGQARRYDYEYERQGTANLFVMCQPLAGWREVKVTDQRRKVDFAHCMKDLVDVHFPDASVIRVVLDNLNTHTPGALYEAFSPAEARRILRKLEFHYTPKHGSWLNMAEIEISILSRQVLKQRIGSVSDLRGATARWTLRRNDQQATINWQFDVTKARTKLAHLYP
jgi:transposase